jgi:hypothetical protein
MNLTLHARTRNVRELILRQAACCREQGTVKRSPDAPPEVAAEVILKRKERFQVRELVHPTVRDTGLGAELDSIPYAVAGQASGTLKDAVSRNLGVSVDIST